MRGSHYSCLLIIFCFAGYGYCFLKNPTKGVCHSNGHSLRYHEVIQNSKLLLTFAKDEGYGLMQITSKQTWHQYLLDFINDYEPLDPRSLWTLQFREAEGRRHEITSRDPCSVPGYPSFVSSNEGDSVLAQIIWKGISVGNEQNSLDVFVNVSIPSGSGVSHWSINIQSRVRLSTLWDVRFVQVQNFGRTSGPSHMYYPSGLGQQKPLQNLDNQYPGGWDFTMQFFSLCHERDCLYYAAHDPKPFAKKFLFKADTYAGTDVGHTPISAFEIVNYPDTMGRELVQYDLPYEIALGVVEGDWWDVSQVYRAWVLSNAEWCRKGPLFQRDVPSWFKNIDLWLNPGFELPTEKGDPQNVLRDVLDFKRNFPTAKFAVHWYNWHKIPYDTNYPDYLPPKDGFAAAVSQLRRNGVEVLPYINGHIADINGPNWISDNAEQYTLKRTGPRLRPSNFLSYLELYDSQQHVVGMCPYTGYWKSKIINLVDSLVNTYGTTGVYIDQVGAAKADLCFDETHGHTIGGGDYWQEGYNHMISTAMERAQQRNPDGVLTTECNGESFQSIFSGLLVWNSFSGTEVNMYMSVYGGWMVPFGRYFKDADLNRNATSFTTKMGQMFISGAQLGWFHQFDIVNIPHAKKYIDTLIQYRQIAKAHLAYGRLLRPPTFSSNFKTPEREFLWAMIGYSKLPVVLTSAWASLLDEYTAPIILVTNTDTKDYQVPLVVDTSDWPTQASPCVRVKRVLLDGSRTEIGVYATPLVQLPAIEVKSFDVALLEFENASHPNQPESILVR